MVMERVQGIPVTDVAALRDAGVNLRKLAENGVAVFFTQVLEHNFFHADMHPGNILVSPEDPENPRYIALDCAIIGSLTRADQDYVARNLLAMFKRDYRRVAELHVASGWVSRKTRIHDFESAIRSLCEPVFERPLGEISFAGLLLQTVHHGAAIRYAGAAIAGAVAEDFAPHRRAGAAALSRVESVGNRPALFGSLGKEASEPVDLGWNRCGEKLPDWGERSAVAAANGL